MLKSMKRIIVYLLCSGMIAGSMSLFPTVAKADTPAVDVGNCTTASSTAAKVVTTTAYNSRDAQAGDRISVTFTKGLAIGKINTIAIGSTTAEKVAKPLVYDWQAQKWPANTSFTLAYDGTSYHFEKPTATAVNPEETPFIVFDLSNTGQSSSAGSASGYVNFPFMDLTKVKKLVVSGKMQSYDKSGTWQKGLSAQIHFFDANNTEITEMSAAYSNQVHLIPWRTVGDIYEINLDNIKNSYDLSSVYGYASESITNIDHSAAEGGYSGGGYWNNGIYVTLTVTETGPKSPYFGEKFGSNLTDVTAVEGSAGASATRFSVSATFPSGENPEGSDGSYAWYYAMPGTEVQQNTDSNWHRIDDTTQITTEGGQVTTFKGMSGKTIAQSSAITLENPRVALSGMKLKVKLLANDGDASHDVNSDISTITIIPAGYTSLTATPLNALRNIGAEMDAASPTQFACIVSWDNGTQKYFTGRGLRFLNDSGATTLDAIQAKIKTEVAAEAVTTDDAGNMTTVVDGVTYPVDHWTAGDTDKYYYSKYSYEDLCGVGTEGIDINAEGTLTSFNHTVVQGNQKLFLIIPDTNSITHSVVAECVITGVDLVGPTMDPIDARWISQLYIEEGTGIVDHFDLGESFVQGGVKNAGFPMHLSVPNVKDNVTDATELTYKWYKNGTEVATSTINYPYAGIEYDAEGRPCAYLVLEGTSADNGAYVCKITDAANNESESQSIVLKAWDTTNPEIEVTIEPDMSTPSIMKEVTISVTDDNLDDNYIAFTDKDSADQLVEDDWSFINHYNITDNGTYYIYARDAAGNIARWTNPSTGESSLTVTNVDHTAPTVDGVELKPSTNPDGAPNTWEGQDANGNPTSGQYITIVVTAHDTDANGNETGNIWYKLEKDGQTIRDWDTNPVFDKIKDSGNYIVYVKDGAGNIYSYPLNNVDVNAITGKLDAGELAQVFGVSVTASPLSWTRENVTINAIGGNVSMLHPQAPFSYDGGNTWTADRQYVASANGNIAFAIKDVYGNVYNYLTIPINNIDKEMPAFTATPSARNNAILINATDDLSGLDEIYYTFNNGAKKTLMTFVEGTLQSETVTLNIDKQGAYTIYVADNAGNVNSKPVEISGALTNNELFEGTQEEVAAKISALITANPTGWTNNNVTLSFTPNSTEGFASQPYSWDGGVNWINSQNYTVSSNGTYVLYVKDVYGNIYSSNAVAVGNIDKVAPTISAEQSGSRMNISASDTQSGVARIAWQGGTATALTTLQTFSGTMGSASCTADLPSNGQYTIYVYDNAGNVNSISKTVTGVTTNTNTNTNTNNSSGKTVEKYYYYNTTEKSVPVYQNSGTTYTQPTYTQPTVVTTPIPAATTTTTTTKSSTPSTASSDKKTTTTKTSTATVSPSTTAKKLTSEVVAATPVTSGKDEEDVTVVSDENLAKYRNSRVNGAVTATSDAKGGSGFNPVFAILAALMTISLLAGGIYWYVAKYKPRLAESEIGEGDGFEFAEDIALEQKEE